MKKIFFANDRIIKILLFLTFVLLSFNYIPQLLRFDTISNGFSRNASWYPLFGLMIYYFSSKKFYKKCDLVTQRMFIFLCLYSFYIFVDTIIGFAKFPYFQEIINGPKDQITKLPKVLSILEFFKLNYTSENITYIWYILRTLKSGIFTILYTFGFSIILFYFIHKYFEKSFNLLRKAVYISLGIICIYSSFEILYLAGSESAKAILAKITPFIFDLYTNGRQYPPLFWYKTQVRSIFIEPSHFGMYAAFVMPILWYNIMKSKRKELFIALTIVLSFLVFMTKARTATLLVIGELFVLMFLLLYFNGKKYLKYIFNIILVVFTGMILSIGFIKYFEMPVAYQMEAKQQATSLKKNNLNIINIDKNKEPQLDGVKSSTNVIANKYNEGTTEKINNNKTKNKFIEKKKINENSIIEKNNLMTEVKKYINQNITSVIGAKNRSNNSRYAIYITNWNIGKEHPFLGVGYGLNKAYFTHYIPEDFVKGNQEIKKWKNEIKKYGLMKFAIADIGEYITMFSQTGIIGLSLFLIPWIFPLIILLKKIKKSTEEKQIQYICFYTMLIGMIVSGFGDNLRILYTPWIVLAFVWALIYPSKEKGGINDCSSNSIM